MLPSPILRSSPVTGDDYPAVLATTRCIALCELAAGKMLTPLLGHGELSVGGLEENVVVTGVNPIVDIRSTTQGTRFNVQELQAIPSARDVFQVLTQTPGITSDRQNVGGTHNGQQIGMFSRGAANGQGDGPRPRLGHPACSPRACSRRRSHRSRRATQSSATRRSSAGPKFRWWF